MTNNQDIAAIIANAVALAMASQVEAPQAPATPAKGKRQPKGPTLSEGAAQVVVKAGPDKGPPPRPIFEVREDFATNEVRASGSRKAYAEAIGRLVGLQYWGEVPMSGETGDNFKAVQDALKEEQKALYGLLRSRGHTNPSVHWSRVRKDAMRPKGKGEREVKTISEVFKPTLEALYKRAWRDQAEFATIEDRQAFKALADTLANVYKVRLATLQHKAEVKTPAKATPKGKASK
jgi:hypothetical protein